MERTAKTMCPSGADVRNICYIILSPHKILPTPILGCMDNSPLWSSDVPIILLGQAFPNSKLWWHILSSHIMKGFI